MTAAFSDSKIEATAIAVMARFFQPPDRKCIELPVSHRSRTPVMEYPSAYTMKRIVQDATK
jgi:hypothetical protein